MDERMRYRVERGDRVVARAAAEGDAERVATFEAITHPGEVVTVIDGMTECMVAWWEWNGDPMELITRELVAT